MDDSRPTWPGNLPQKPPSIPPSKRVLALFVGGEEIILHEGEFILGRSPACDITVEDMLVSRVHAKISVSDGAVILRDLGSANGVYVNSVRIDMPTPLRDGDRVLMGTKEVSVFAVRVGSSSAKRASGTHPRAVASSARPSANASGGATTDHAPAIEQGYARASQRARRLREEAQDLPRTEKSDTFVQLGLLARRMMDSGRVDGAIRVLSEHMRNVIAGARSGRAVPSDVLRSASEFAMAFADAKLDAAWVDYVIELHMAVRRPMSAESIDHFCSLRRKNVHCNPDTMLFYKAMLQREEAGLSLSQRVLVARILSLSDDDE